MMTDRRRISGCLWTLALVVAFFMALVMLIIKPMNEVWRYAEFC